MKICMLGTGYVGLCSGVGLASVGHQVTCVGRDTAKVDNINRGIPPIYEDGLEDMLKRLLAKHTFTATNDLHAAVQTADVIFLCVGTPCNDEGRIDLRDMEAASQQVGNAMKNTPYQVIVVKSTVVPGTTERMLKIIEDASGKTAGKDFGVCMNPEFLREGKALEDFLKPDRVVIGEHDSRAGGVVASLYASFGAPILHTNLRTAEMIKYASNSLLATKISFSNEVGNVCKKLGIDVYDVMKGVGLDRRISPHFLEAGLGFGGSCFPKDVSALKSLAQDLGSDTQLLQSVLDVNKRQRFTILSLLERKLSVSGKTIAILGLAFKAGTDDIREAPSLDIIAHLLEKGARVQAYDPQAMEHVRKRFPAVTYCSSAQDAIRGADACLVLTEWPAFSRLTKADFSTMKGRIILEGRKILSSGIGSEGVCW